MKNRLNRRLLAACAASISLAASGPGEVVGSAHAGPVVQLQVTAMSELPHDEMVVQLAIERTGPTAEKLNDEVLVGLNRALEKAKAVPGIRARLGSITTQPEWGPQGKATGWQVRGVMVLEGRDLRATGALAGELSSDMQIAGVSFRLTELARASEQAHLLKQAAAAFNERARATAEAFGFSAFELQKLIIDHGGGDQPRPLQMEMRAAGMASKASVPTDGGDATVTLTVSGSVELK